MKIKSHCIRVCLMICFTLATACGGGSAQDETSLHSCVDGVCADYSENAQGNFTVGYYKEDGYTDMPKINVNSDILTVTCDSNATTENGNVYFSCNMTSDADIIADCFHGVVYYYIDSEAYSTACTSHNFYCDDYGFNPAEVCNTTGSNLVTDEGDASQEN